MNHSELINQMGGTIRVANLCSVSSQAVSKWRKTGIPKARMMYLGLVFPDLFNKHDLLSTTTYKSKNRIN